MVLKREHFGK